jgi:hypothetical protein
VVSDQVLHINLHRSRREPSLKPTHRDSIPSRRLRPTQLRSSFG